MARSSAPRPPVPPSDLRRAPPFFLPPAPSCSAGGRAGGRGAEGAGAVSARLHPRPAHGQAVAGPVHRGAGWRLRHAPRRWPTARRSRRPRSAGPAPAPRSGCSILIDPNLYIFRTRTAPFLVPQTLPHTVARPHRRHTSTSQPPIFGSSHASLCHAVEPLTLVNCFLQTKRGEHTEQAHSWLGGQQQQQDREWSVRVARSSPRSHDHSCFKRKISGHKLDKHLAALHLDGVDLGAGEEERKGWKMGVAQSERQWRVGRCGRRRHRQAQSTCVRSCIDRGSDASSGSSPAGPRAPPCP